MKVNTQISIVVALLMSINLSEAQNNIMKNVIKGEIIQDNKRVIYQMMVRLFGNKNTTNKFNGSKEENGVGKFNDISDKALVELKKLGITDVWYTGIIEHATMTDYSNFGIKADDPDIVKGRAGSPYAIKDYYDVDPDLAVDVNNRMAEFEALVKRTHDHDLKVLMDFVPNHVARTYNSDAKPKGVFDFGEKDNTSKAFDPANDFYYILDKPFVVPLGANAGGNDYLSCLKDGKFTEFPAKATGNNVFSEAPSLNDWSETIKLNYGVDYQNGEKTYFNPLPPVWLKMRDILVFWANKKVDGFRCDVTEMVPVEFWSWVIPQVKKVRPDLIFVAEAYNPKEYKKYLSIGKFDFLYDKVGLYDGLKRLIKNESTADVKDISYVNNEESWGFSSNMLRFLENHDEERIASDGFTKNPWLAFPAMVVSATLSSGPVMIYSGQEVGEPGAGKEGFGSEDNRTSIFDYWGVPEHQKWMNNGAFDGGKLSDDHQKLRKAYAKLFKIATSNEAIRKGNFIELSGNNLNNRMYAYLRFTDNQKMLVVANFDRTKTLDSDLVLPNELFQSHLKKTLKLKDLLTGKSFMVNDFNNIIPVKVLPSSAMIITLTAP